jgi:RNA polymerase sigma-70 factor (ECF subfamily)
MDIEAVKRAKNGDADEIGKIILENMPSLYRVAFSILRTEEEISDAISNTTVKVFEKIHTLKNEEFFKTWLTKILINECYKIYNQNKKIIYLENCDNGDMPYNDTYSDFETRNLIKKLGKDLREIVILYYFEDFSVKEISKIMKIPEGTVKSRLSRARKELEKELIDNNNKDVQNKREDNKENDNSKIGRSGLNG